MGRFKREHQPELAGGHGDDFRPHLSVLLVLSDVLRKLCDDAIRNAKRAGRDIVTDRDLPPPPSTA